MVGPGLGPLIQMRVVLAKLFDCTPRYVMCCTAERVVDPRLVPLVSCSMRWSRVWVGCVHNFRWWPASLYLICWGIQIQYQICAAATASSKTDTCHSTLYLQYMTEEDYCTLWALSCDSSDRLTVICSAAHLQTPSNTIPSPPPPPPLLIYSQHNLEHHDCWSFSSSSLRRRQWKVWTSLVGLWYVTPEEVYLFWAPGRDLGSFWQWFWSGPLFNSITPLR